MSNRIAQDHRIDPRIKAMFGRVPLPDLPDVPSREALLEMVAQAATADPQVADPAPFEAFAPREGLDISTQSVISHPDGNVINLMVIRPESAIPLACVYYIHGGGMMMGSCFDPHMAAWGRLVAAQGVAVVLVDFRNCLVPSSVPEVAPFPAGLNDCVSGLRWVHENAAALSIDADRIVVAGESGGGNLSVAVALKLKQDGDLGLISGIYVMCPYLAGEANLAPDSSEVRNNGILMTPRTNYGATAYGIEQLHARNPLAWPAFAGEDDVAGFPPVVISVNECDPLRDDGVAFYRLLMRAGVPVRCKEVMGTIHATEVICLACPDISREAARELAAFASG